MKTLKLIKNDPWLAPYKQAIEGRHNRAVEKISELTGGTGNLSDFADGYLYFGLHKENGHWVFREWAPNANAGKYLFFKFGITANFFFLLRHTDVTFVNQ